MSEPFLDKLRIDPGSQKQRGVGVSKPMEIYIRKPVAFQDL